MERGVSSSGAAPNGSFDRMESSSYAVLPGEREFPFFKGIFNIKGKRGIYLLNRDFP
jgi:hypothetical protein